MHAKPFIDAGADVVRRGPLDLLGRLCRLARMAPAPYGAFPSHSGRACFAPGRTLVLLAAGTSFATVLVRLVFPWDIHQFGELQLWQGLQYLAMFGLGIVAAQRGWLDPVPDQIRRKGGAVALIRMLSFLAHHRRDPRHRH